MFVLAIIAVLLAGAVYQLNSVVTRDKAQLAKADSETSKVKADVDTANARSADLQLQLGRAKGHAEDLKSQLDKAQARQSDLQSQLEGVRADLRSQVDKAKAQSSEMHAEFQAKLNSAKDESSGLRKDLDQARSQAESLKSQLAKAQGDLTKLQPLALKARAMPLAASFEKNFWDRGFTMHVRNLNPDPMKVTITITESGKASARSAMIEGAGLLNVENLTAGARVVIGSAGFDTLSATAQ